MIYENAFDREREKEEQGTKNLFSSFRMAAVVSLDAGRPIIRFYGESTESKKKYKYLSSYSPAAGDTVLLAKINGSYVIIGKVV